MEHCGMCLAVAAFKLVSVVSKLLVKRGTFRRLSDRQYPKTREYLIELPLARLHTSYA